MASISYNKLWQSKSDNTVSKRDKLQDLNINLLKLQVHDTYKKDEKVTTNFAYLDEKFSKIIGHLSS